MEEMKTSDSWWSLGFTDLILLSFIILFMMTSILAYNFNPQPIDGPEINKPLDRCEGDCKTLIDSLRSAVGSAQENALKYYHLYKGLKNKCDCKVSGPDTISGPSIPYPLFVSINWDEIGGGANVRMYVTRKGSNEILSLFPISYREHSWGSLWHKGVDFVPNPDIAFVQPDSLITGSYDIYVRVTRSIEIEAKGFIYFNSPGGNREMIDIDTLSIRNTSPPWREDGEMSRIGTIIVEQDTIIWKPKNLKL